jgi:hypothetical protein
MKFNGKQLFELGVPQNKIKFFVNVEFESEQALLDKLNEKSENIKKPKVFTWVDWVFENFKPEWMPARMNGNVGELMSRSEMKRLLDSKSIEINGKFPTSETEVTDDDFPIKSFIWFPNGKRKTNWGGIA